jgi:hypothetical protein
MKMRIMGRCICNADSDFVVLRLGMRAFIANKAPDGDTADSQIPSSVARS